ncbi:MAG TPA: hypothetical protein VGJ21_03435, partial [Terracidiphilus sp.]
AAVSNDVMVAGTFPEDTTVATILKAVIPIGPLPGGIQLPSEFVSYDCAARGTRRAVRGAPRPRRNPALRAIA